MALLRFKQTYLALGLRPRRTTRAARPPVRGAGVRRAPSTRSGAGGCCSTTAPGSSCCGCRCAERDSPWAAGRSRRSRATLPPLRGDERDAVRRLAAEGPPEEEVGLTPYGAAAARRRPDRPERTRRPARCRPCRGARRWTQFLWVVVPLRLPDGLRGRALLALPLRQVRLDDPVLAALRGPAAADGQPAVPLRHPRGVPRPRDRAGHPEVVDRGGRASPRAMYHFMAVSVGALAGLRTVVGMAILIYRRRTVGPGLLGDHPDGQGHVRLPRRRDPARPLQHGRGEHRSATTTTARASRSGSAGSSASTCTRT